MEKIILFKCYRCDKESDSVEEIISHLKNVHNVVQNDDKMHCVAAKNCSRVYYTFQKLKLHSKQCIKKVYRRIKLNYIHLFFKLIMVKTLKVEHRATELSENRKNDAFEPCKTLNDKFEHVCQKNVFFVLGSHTFLNNPKNFN